MRRRNLIVCWWSNTVVTASTSPGLGALGCTQHPVNLTRSLGLVLNYIQRKRDVELSWEAGTWTLPPETRAYCAGKWRAPC